MTENLLRSFDRLRWLERYGYLQRRLLFLDLNYWIRISESSDSTFRELVDKLNTALDQAKISCPISPSLLMEVDKQVSSEKRNRYYSIMDKFSGRLSLRLTPVIFSEEFKGILEGRSVTRDIAFSHILDAFLAGRKSSFPSEGWTSETIEGFAHDMFEHLENMPLAEFMKMNEGVSRTSSIELLRNNLRELAQKEQSWRMEKKLSRSSVEEAEFTAIVHAFLPQIGESWLSTSPHESVDSLDTSLAQKRQMLDACPTFWCEYKLLSALRVNRKRVEENDLWDLQHVIAAIPYVDCLACDSGTRHLCSQVLQVEEKFGTKVVSTPRDLIMWLDSFI